MSVGSTIVVDTHGLGGRLLEGHVSVAPAVTAVITSGGRLLQSTVRAKASGRPGPRVQTGDYRRSIRLQTGQTIGRLGNAAPYATVYTDSPQGQRLENGFIGIDSLGRHYHQPPFPHFGPAALEVDPVISRAMERAVDDITARIA